MVKKSLLATCLIVAFFLCLHLNVKGQNSPSQDPKARVAELKASLQQNPNHLQYTEYMMLKHKYPEAAGTDSPYSYNYDYYLKPSGSSPLSQEFSGGFNSPDQAMFDGIDIITGARAVDESLQVGSIGADRVSPLDNSNYRQLQSALELYFNDNSGYPDNLNQLVPNYIGILPPGFTYQKTGSTFQLLREEAALGQIEISQVQALEIKSHPWESMVKTLPKIPGIFSLVPADDVVIYFNNMDKFSQLEQTITSIGKPLQSIYSLNNAVEVKQKIFQRLGIKDIKEMRGLVDEAGLVAYDLDAYPNTDYALVLKIKNSLLSNFTSTYITAPKERQAQVGEYYVIATDNSFLQTIVNAQKNKDRALAGKKELAYALSVLEPDFDGFAYFSEDFVKKLTAPAYRINARRRNTVLQALETLQYASFAYRGITGAWPASFDQMVNQGYMQGGTVANSQDYFIDSQGIVKHKIWGSIYDITPIDRVPITTVTLGESNLYNSFKEGYKNYWREYIDPVGVAITVGDQIRFHTIILPLIEKSEYNWIKDIAGGDGVAFDFLSNPDRLPSMQGLMKINVDDALYAVYKQSPGEFDESYQKCRNDYYKTLYQTIPTNQIRPTLEDQCKASEKTREQAIALIKDKVAKAIGWKEKTPVFDFIGNEITVAGGENLVFNVEDLSRLDIYIGVELKDQALAKKFLDQVFTWYRDKMSGGDSGSGGYGFFKVDSGRPLKNSYNGVDYYMVPLGGLTNIYYAFFNSRFYLTISQSAMNNLIDGKKQGALKWPDHMQRLFDYMGDKMNLGFIVDNTKLQPWLKGYIKNQWASYSGAAGIRTTVSYYAEALELAKVLPNYDGSVANAASYYRFAPTQWFDATILSKNGNVYLSSNNQEYNLNDVDLGGTSYYGYNGDGDVKKIAKTVKLADITKNFNIDKTLADWQKLKDLGIAFSLSKEGLDIRIVFSNAASSAIDSRVGKAGGFWGKFDVKYAYAGGGVAVILVLFGGMLWVIRRQKKSQTLAAEDAAGQAPEVVVPGNQEEGPEPPQAI